MNRRMRNRTYGGVGGRREQSRLLPDVRQAWRVAPWRRCWSGWYPADDLEVPVDGIDGSPLRALGDEEPLAEQQGCRGRPRI